MATAKTNNEGASHAAWRRQQKTIRLGVDELLQIVECLKRLTSNLQSLEDGAFRGIHSIEVKLFTLEESSQPVVSIGESGTKVVLRRVAAALLWYSRGDLSQSKAAEIAGTSRAEFIDELSHRRIPVVQVTAEELQYEIHRA